ncbi:MAG: helicase-related protein, partial [Promethearchaeota archaeon]
IKPVRFVGQKTKSDDDKGLSQTRQIEILDQFKEGKYNVLVSTNIGEEGLDIAECDLVIFYDVVASEIRLIQRKGRTARHREGKVVILYSKNTRDEIYLRIALSKLKKMNVNLRNPQQLKDSYKWKDQLVVPERNDRKSIDIKKKEKSLKKGVEKNFQSNLQNFIDRKQESKSAKIVNSINISKSLPMKFGVRNRLQVDKIPYTIADSDLHIVIHNEVLIQIYNPKSFDTDSLLTEINDFRQISSLLIIIFDFTDFHETIEGEKRLLKRNILKFTKEHNIQTISIDNEEELYFIIKNILETKRGN